MGPYFREAVPSMRPEGRVFAIMTLLEVRNLSKSLKRLADAETGLHFYSADDVE
jgi:hypothetical protein